MSENHEKSDHTPMTPVQCGIVGAFTAGGYSMIYVTIGALLHSSAPNPGTPVNPDMFPNIFLLTIVMVTMIAYSCIRNFYWFKTEQEQDLKKRGIPIDKVF